MEYVILFRFQNGGVEAIRDGDYMAIFKNFDDAATLAEDHILLQGLDYQIVELDEL